MSKNAMNKTRTPISAVCLITDPNLCAAHLRCNQPQRQWIQRAPTLSTTGIPIQKCPELIPASPPGAYEGRAKWAEVDVLGRSPAGSVTTPSWGDEAHAESSHAITKANIPHSAARLFTKPSLPITEANATGGTRGLMPKETSREKILRGKRSSPLVLHGRQLGRA